MNEDFVPYELAVKLIEKGFNYETRDIYERNTLACRYEDVPKPTISQVLKWLREEKKIFVAIDYYPAGYNAVIYTGLSQEDGFFDNEGYLNECDCYNTYEQAALAGIKYCLDNMI